jgi:para-aminobenzoate synthetase/4-amino-4-deoxychorismate lyase
MTAVPSAPALPLKAPFVLLDDSRDGASGTLYRRPLAVIAAWTAAEVAPALARLDRATAAGHVAAGFLAYELGYVLEPALAPLLPPRRQRHLPLLWLGVFAVGEPVAKVDAWLAAAGGGGGRLVATGPGLDRDAYRRRFRRVHDLIRAGDVYQVNLTFMEQFRFEGDPIAIYRDLRRRQPVAHGALIGLGDHVVLSVSPELFVEATAGMIAARPMKGTQARGPTAAADARLARALAEDGKARAENLMIVDLIRNDIGRVAATGSVAVTDLYTVETLPTLHQMTSGITARLSPGVTPAALIRALFPCGSITGAPKIRAMQIIRELEDGPRGVYTGAIGRFGPGGDVRLSVAIRTLVLAPGAGGRAGVAGLGVGSGLVHESDADAEYDECRLKARFLEPPDRDFRLVETLAWHRGSGYRLLDRHMARLAASARWFGFAHDRPAVEAALAAAAAAFVGDGRRVRLLLAADGRLAIESQPLAPTPPSPLRARLWPQPRRLDDPFLYHKTTRREPYDRALGDARQAAGCDEVIFVNARGELAEGAWTNVFVERGGRLLTPPVAAGLLDGTLRQALLAEEPGRVGEAALSPADLDGADRIWLGNGVRGLMAVEIV